MITRADVWMELGLLVAMVTSVVNGEFPLFENFCNQTIQLKYGEVSGKIRLNPSRVPQICWTDIVALSGYTLRYRLNKMASCDCSLFNCQNYAKIYPLDTQLEDTYCHSNKSEISFSEILTNELHIRMHANSLADDTSFDLDFYIVHYGSCLTDEVDCMGCINKKLTCNNEEVNCGFNKIGICSDPETLQAPNGVHMNVFIIVVTLISLIMVTSIVACICIRHERIRKNTRQLFTNAGAVIVTTTNGQTQTPSTGPLPNRAWNESGGIPTDSALPVDISLFYPPPEYSSLTVVVNKPLTDDNEEQPPSYIDAINNQEKYYMVDLVQHM